MVKTTIKIKGIMCENCVAHVNETIKNEFDINKVTTSKENGISEVISDNELSEEKLREVISREGYEVTEVMSEPYEKKWLFGFGKKK